MKFKQIIWRSYISHKDCFVLPIACVHQEVKINAVWTRCLCVKLRWTTRQVAMNSYVPHSQLRCTMRIKHFLFTKKFTVQLNYSVASNDPRDWRAVSVSLVHCKRPSNAKIRHAFPTWFSRYPLVFIVAITVSEWGKCEIDRPKLQQIHQVRNVCIYRVTVQILVWLKIHWSLFPRAQLTTIQYRFSLVSVNVRVNRQHSGFETPVATVGTVW